MTSIGSQEQMNRSSSNESLPAVENGQKGNGRLFTSVLTQTGGDPFSQCVRAHVDTDACPQGNVPCFYAKSPCIVRVGVLPVGESTNPPIAATLTVLNQGETEESTRTAPFGSRGYARFELPQPRAAGVCSMVLTLHIRGVDKPPQFSFGFVAIHARRTRYNNSLVDNLRITRLPGVGDKLASRLAAKYHVVPSQMTIGYLMLQEIEGLISILKDVVPTRVENVLVALSYARWRRRLKCQAEIDELGKKTAGSSIADDIHQREEEHERLLYVDAIYKQLCTPQCVVPHWTFQGAAPNVVSPPATSTAPSSIASPSYRGPAPPLSTPTMSPVQHASYSTSPLPQNMLPEPAITRQAGPRIANMEEPTAHQLTPPELMEAYEIRKYFEQLPMFPSQKMIEYVMRTESATILQAHQRCQEYEQWHMQAAQAIQPETGLDFADSVFQADGETRCLEPVEEPQCVRRKRDRDSPTKIPNLADLDSEGVMQLFDEEDLSAAIPFIDSWCIDGMWLTECASVKELQSCDMPLDLARQVAAVLLRRFDVSLTDDEDCI